MGPDPAVAAVRLAVRHRLPPEDARPVMVACSGGADSLALLCATVFELRRTRRRVVGVTVDHGLQDGSDVHARAVVAQMAALGADETMTLSVRVHAPGTGPEAAARRARYAALTEAASRTGAGHVLLGHTRDDQAETVLLGLTRGSGGRSLAGMRRGFTEGEVSFLRPLLHLTRAQTEQACRAEGVAWWSDPHNADPRFTRSRLRHRVLPVLEEELGPGVAAALARTADGLQEDMTALDDIAERTHDDASCDGGLAVTRLGHQPRAVVSRVLRRAAVAAGCPPAELFRVHVVALVDMVGDRDRGAQVQLPGHVTGYRDGDLLRFRRTGSDVAG